MGFNILLREVSAEMVEFFLLFGLHFLVIILFLAYYYNKSKSKQFCDSLSSAKSHLSAKRQLVTWRYVFYFLLGTPILIVFFSCTVPFIIRYILHFILLVLFGIILHISVPSWICKLRYKSYKCNCDFYEYSDFYPGIAFAVGFSGVLFLLPENLEFALILLLSYFLILILLYFFSPRKKLDEMAFSKEYALTSVSDLQNFLIENINKKKIITFVHGGCEFCKLQIGEINRLNQLAKKFIRVLDLTKGKMIDSFIFQFLNIDTQNLSYPSSLIIENGISTDTKEGVLSLVELEQFLSTTEYF